MTAKAQLKGVRPPQNYVAYFSLCQAIAGQFEDTAKRIGVSGIHAPVFYPQLIGDLESMKGFCDRAINAVNEAQKQWETGT